MKALSMTKFGMGARGLAAIAVATLALAGCDEIPQDAVKPRAAYDGRIEPDLSDAGQVDVLVTLPDHILEEVRMAHAIALGRDMWRRTAFPPRPVPGLARSASV